MFSYNVHVLQQHSKANSCTWRAASQLNRFWLQLFVRLWKSIVIMMDTSFSLVWTELGVNEPLSLCHAATSLHIPTHLNTCAYLMGCTKVQQPMLNHYHKTEGIQIIGPLKLSYVNWAKLQRARVAVAEPDADIITECRLLWKEKKALMNLPWLPVFSSITKSTCDR